jgi:hypothetical protein
MDKNRGKKLVVSLKSSSIEISVVDFGKVPEILFATKETLLFKEALQADTFISKSLEGFKNLLRKNINEIVRELKGSHECEVIFHSPWFLPELITAENKKNEVSLKQFFMEKVKPPEQQDYQQIENKITNILLNGYHLTKLKDVKSNDIEINLFRSYSSKETIKKVKEVISSELKQIRQVEFSTSTMEIYESLKDLFINEDNLIFLNIGGEVTEIGIIENDILIHFATIPMGSHLFSRELDTFITERGNLSTLKFLGDKATDEKLDKIKLAKIEETKNVWKDEIFQALEEEKGELPEKVFVISNSDSIDFFRMLLDSCEDCKNFEFFNLNQGVFKDKVIGLENVTMKNVEYLLSAYYLSIKT